MEAEETKVQDTENKDTEIQEGDSLASILLEVKNTLEGLKQENAGLKEKIENIQRENYAMAKAGLLGSHKDEDNNTTDSTDTSAINGGDSAKMSTRELLNKLYGQKKS